MNRRLVVLVLAAIAGRTKRIQLGSAVTDWQPGDAVTA